jgi:hypothetical protein
VFKNLPKKNFDEEDIKEVIRTVLREKYTEKILKTRKITNKVKLERETERLDQNGNPKSRVEYKNRV